MVKMGNLQVLNFISPSLFYINSIKVNENLRFNFAAFHYLTSFGYDIGSNFFIAYKKQNLFFALHNYHNLNTRFYGIETQLIDKEIKAGTKTILLSPSLHVWSQPTNQSFRTSSAALGAKAELRISTALGSIWRPYINLSAKTKGWVAGDVYLNSNFSCRVGISAFLSKQHS